MRRILVIAMLLMSVGCIKPYDVPEFAEIKNHETAYLVPLEDGSQSNQAKFNSESALDKNRVALKRVQIPHRWVQTGRFWNSGEYMDTVRLVVVDRSPVTREWTADGNSGSTPTNQAIWLESSDSIGFSLGFSCTGFVDEPDTSKFLYWYPTTTKTSEEGLDKSSASLAHIMDNEVRARVQSIANAVAARYDLDDLRGKKPEIINAVRNGIPPSDEQEGITGVIQHFADRGITITNLGQFGGFAYEQPNIQTAIDETFVAQQEKVRTEATFEAQQKVNEKIELAAEAAANKMRTEAKGKADSIKTEAEAEAAAIRLVAQATKEANGDPVFLQLKQLEIESQKAQKWNGIYPQTLMGGEIPNLLMEINAEASLPQ